MQLLWYYLRSGEEKNFPWRENPTADLLFDPNLQQTAYIKKNKNMMELLIRSYSQ